MLGMLFVNFFFAEDVTLSLNAPNQVEAGTEIYVEVTLNKSDFESFARFQQELPAGLTPIAINTCNSDFSFENRKLKFIWLKLPAEEKITISYKLMVDKRLKGSFSLNGKFSYIANNERLSADVTPKIIIITPSPDIDPNLIVDISEFKNLVNPNNNLAYSNQVHCIRQIPYLSGNEYIVNLLVSKGDKEKFAKIQENVPDGYKAESIESKDAIFTFKNQTVKFLWMTLPQEPYFVVTYKLIPDESNQSVPEIAGTFSFIEHDNTLSIDIVEKNVSLKNKSKENLMAVISTSGIEVVRDYVQPADYTGKVTIEIAESAKRLLSKNTKLTNVLEPESGVYYRVQVAAGHRPINIKRYFNKYNLDKEIRTEFHDGWRKYSVGSFYVYKAARDYRIHIWNTTTINDAFVAAYNSGNRITVQEALMISNHKWYR